MFPFLTLLAACLLSVPQWPDPLPTPEAGVDLWRSISEASFIVEVELLLPPRANADSALLPGAPDVPLQPSVITEAMKTARISRWLRPASETVSIMLPPYLQILPPASNCWPEAQRQGRLRAILLFRERKDRSLEQLTDAETGCGHNTSLNPSYPAYVEALRAALSWRPDPKVPAETRWRAQKDAMRSPNPYLRRLAVAFLTAQRAELAVEEEIRAQTGDVQEWKARLKEQTSAPLCAER